MADEPESKTGIIPQVCLGVHSEFFVSVCHAHSFVETLQLPVVPMSTVIAGVTGAMLVNADSPFGQLPADAGLDNHRCITVLPGKVHMRAL